MDFFTNTNILFFLAAYLIGSIPFGSILAKTFAGVDITTAGSKSIGQFPTQERKSIID